MTKSPPIHLGRLVTWNKVLQVLGASPPTSVLPYFGLCPVCSGNSLYIFHDTVNSTEWHYCELCKQSGDMIQLAQRAWNLDLPATVNKLWNELPELKIYQIQESTVRKYEQNIVNVQVRAKEFWKMASARLINGVGLRQLRLAMDITSSMSEEDWAKTGGQFIGSAERKEVDEFIDYSDHSIFQHHGSESKNWRTMVVIPFYDAPEHMSAILVCREEDNKAIPFKYHSILHQNFAPKNQVNCGIAMLPALFNSKEERGFVFLDPLLAARTHIKHYSVSPTTLPLVAVWPTAPVVPLIKEISPSRELIFFDHKLTPDLIRHAAAVNGKVVHDTTVQGIYRYSRRTTMFNWLQKLRKESRSWDVVLEEHLAELAAVDVEQWFLMLRWSTQQIKEFVESCTPKVRQKLGDIFASRFQQKEVQLDNFRIFETNAGWVKQGTGELISDTPFRIDRIINYRVSEQLLYEGQIIHRGQAIPFLADKAEFEKAPFEWIDNYLIKKGIGSVDFSQTWQRHAVTLAKRFSPPQTIQGIDNYGWNNDDASFYFPTYAIKVGGYLVRHQLPHPNSRLTPALELAEPVQMTPDEITYIGLPGTERKTLWAMFACVMHNLLAPVYSYSTSGILLVDNLGMVTPELASAMGCPRANNFLQGGTIYASKLSEDEAKTVWPLFFDGKPRKGPGALAWLDSPLHNCFVGVDWYTTRTLAVKGGWLRIPSKISNRPNPELVRIAKKLVPAYVKHLAEHRWRRQSSDFTHPVDQVAYDICQWFAALGGDVDTAREGCDIVDHDYTGSNADAFFQLLLRLYEQNVIIINESGKIPRGKIGIYNMGGKVYIPKAGINQALARQTVYVPVLDVGAVSLALTETEELIDETSLAGVPCWVITKQTWDVRMKSLQMRRRHEKKELA
jgi:hypothetical protein